MLNQILKNRYQVTAQLGKGAMGLVYCATDLQTQQAVAVKVIAADLAMEPGILARFRREGEALRQLRHRNIVAFGEMFEHQSQQVIVMEYVPGGDLRALIRRGPLATVEAVRLTLQLCDALVQAHDIGIIHRDIKPENVLLTPEGVPKLSDFGIARLVGGATGLTHAGAVLGTPVYMSPEAWAGRPLDAQADVWSLGVMVYQMVSGQLPFPGDTLPAVMKKVLTEAPPDLRALQPQTPEALVRIIEHMLAREKGDRYETMRQVAVDLEQIQRSLRRAPGTEVQPGQEAQPSGRTPPEARPRRPGQTSSMAPARPRHGTVPSTLAFIGAGMLVLVCLLVVAGLGLWAAMGKLLTPVALTVRPTATVTLAPLTSAPDPSVTSQPSVAAAMPVPAATSLPPATDTPVPPTLTPTATPTATPPPTLTPFPTLGIGSTQVSDIDGMTLIYVPGGNFLMGSTNAFIDASGDEKPQHTVYLDTYWIDQTDVTNAMFAKFVAATQYQTDAEKAGISWYYDPATDKWPQANGADWQHPRGPSSDIRGLDNHPVVQVSWNDAKAYCAWAGRQLPTEAQWEKAAGGIDGRMYPWGDQAPDPTLLNFHLQVKTTTETRHYPLGASAYGALDMAGNVWQWVADWYGATYYSSSPGRNPAGPASGDARVLRGGSWYDDASLVRVAYRFKFGPDFRNINIGFRCARSN